MLNKEVLESYFKIAKGFVKVHAEAINFDSLQEKEYFNMFILQEILSAIDNIQEREIKVIENLEAKGIKDFV